MNELFIDPNVPKKTMRVSGVIAAGEHVRVTVRNTYGMRADTTRLRIMCGERVVALFPIPEEAPVEEVEPVEGQADAWDDDGNDISCVINLNTVQAEMATRCSATPCMIVLDDVSEGVRQLYGAATHRLERWVKRPDDDVPVDLDGFPGLIEQWREEISNISIRVERDHEGYSRVVVRDKDGSETSTLVYDGKQGPAGRDGRDGADGRNGVDGKDGIDGNDGKSIVGPQGIQGVPGPEGKQGPAGPEGRQGPRGFKGEPGNDGSPGQRGEKGDKGDPGEVTLDQLNTEIGKAKADLLVEIGKLGRLELKRVSVRPATGESGVIYLVPSEKSASDNIYDEYLWIEGKWELVGSTAVDLSGYVKDDDDFKAKKAEWDAKADYAKVKDVFTPITYGGEAFDCKLLSDGSTIAVMSVDGRDQFAVCDKGGRVVSVASGILFGGKSVSKGEYLLDVLSSVSDIAGKRDKNDMLTVWEADGVEGQPVYEDNNKKFVWHVGETTFETEYGTPEDFVGKVEFVGEFSSFFATRQKIATEDLIPDVSNKLDGPTDESLAYPGKAADAKAAGDAMKKKADECTQWDVSGVMTRPCSVIDSSFTDDSFESFWQLTVLDRASGETFVYQTTIGDFTAVDTSIELLYCFPSGGPIPIGSTVTRKRVLYTGDAVTFDKTKPAEERLDTAEKILQSAADACKVNPSTALALKDRDCCLVAYTEGMTFTFAAKEEGQTGLRSFEVVVTGCAKDGAVNWPAVTYRGDSTDLIPDDGDNHWTFAEQQDGSFAVTRHIANTFTIGE